MDSAKDSFRITIQETLLPHNVHQPRIKNPKAIFMAMLVFILLIATSTISLSISYKKPSKRVDFYKTGSAQYYCHLTTYSSLCYDSLSSVLDSIALKSGPGPIFSASLQVAIDLLHEIDASISEMLFLNNSLAQPRMSGCRKWVRDSLSQLNESLAMLGVDSDVESLTYEEINSIKARNMAGIGGSLECLAALKEIDDVDDGVVGLRERIGVEVVRMGVEKARKYIVNGIELMDRRETILNDFYNPYIEYDDYYYSLDYYIFYYGFLVCMYFGLYVFLALLYFLFWRGN